MDNVDATFVEGISLRDYYAGLAMQGIVARDKNVSDEDIERAFFIADKMMEVRDANS
jgi:hypothetical protein